MCASCGGLRHVTIATGVCRSHSSSSSLNGPVDGDFIAPKATGAALFVTFLKHAYFMVATWLLDRTRLLLLSAKADI